jgi:hypothetical protein
LSLKNLDVTSLAAAAYRRERIDQRRPLQFDPRRLD